MIVPTRTRIGIQLVCGAVVFLTAGRGWAGPPSTTYGPVPGLYLGAESRGYPYYPGYRDYPGYPFYRGYPDYFGYPCYPRKGYAAGYQPAHPYILEFFGLHPAIWRFTDYYSGTYPSYYAGIAPDFRGPVAGPPGPDGPLPPTNSLGTHPSPHLPARSGMGEEEKLLAPLYRFGQGGGGRGAFSAPSLPASAPARINVNAPANAEVWFDGWKTSLHGSVGRFSTSLLQPGNVYAYDVTARWEANGRPVTRKQQVVVTAGATVNMVFSTEPEAPANP